MLTVAPRVVWVVFSVGKLLFHTVVVVLFLVGAAEDDWSKPVDG